MSEISKVLERLSIAINSWVRELDECGKRRVVRAFLEGGDMRLESLEEQYIVS